MSDIFIMIRTHITGALSLAIVIYACRVLAGSLLLTAGVVKLFQPQPFWKAVRAYGVPVAYVKLTTKVIATIELLAGASILLNFGQPATGMIGATMFGLFALVVARAILNGEKGKPCGCGVGSGRITWLVVMRNLALVSIALISRGDGPAFSVALLMPYILGLIAQAAITGKKVGPADRALQDLPIKTAAGHAISATRTTETV